LSFRTDGTAYGTLTLDLGPHGARFSTLKRVHVSERVLLDIQLPSANIGCEGSVCWVTPRSDGQYDFGVRFLNITEGQRSFLERFLGRTH
jgi:hypothetical protein